ncbi:hypothetical protein GCM10017744_011060 [Streptomyces antimycoticus]
MVFSSIAGVWGSGGQAAYGAANAHLDALVEDRRARGLAGTAVAWGPWAESGMAAGSGGEQLARRGLISMAPDLAIAALQGAIAGDDGVVTVADMDWERFAPAFTMGRPSPLIGELPEVVSALEQARAAEEGHAEAGSRLRERLSALAPVSGSAPCWIWCAVTRPRFSVSREWKAWSRTGRSRNWALTRSQR